MMFARWLRAFLPSRGRPPNSLAGAMITSANDVLKDPEWPPSWPFIPSNFDREDFAPDSRFYDVPRICFHIDETAVQRYFQNASRLHFASIASGDVHILLPCGQSWY